MMEYLLEDNQKEPKEKDSWTFQQYLNQKLKYGKSQMKLTLPLKMMLFSQGSESIVLGLIIPVLSQEWHISTFDKSLLITSVYIGTTFGSGFQSIADKYGRYPVITLAGVIQAITGLLSAFAGDFNFFLFMRIAYGIGIGIVLPLSGTYISEITPTDLRGKQLVQSRLAWTFGTILTCIVSYFMIANMPLGSSRWRTTLILVCVPGLIALAIHLVSGKESPRYLLLRGDIEKARQIMSQMERDNEVKPLEHHQFQAIVKWVDRQKNHHGTQIPFWKMFDPEFKDITLRLFIAWFTVCFIYYGTMLVLPLILAHNFASTPKNNYLTIILVSLTELFGFYLAQFPMDHPQFGRKNTTVIGFAIGLVSSVILLLMNADALILGILFIFIKFSTCVCFITLYPYTAELYPTLLRSKAMGVTSMVGRIAIVFLGCVGVYAVEWLNGKALYLIFSVLALLSVVAMRGMPYETLGKEMDKR